VSPSQARRLFDAVPDGVLAVAVLRDPLPELLSAAIAAGARAVQCEASHKPALPGGVVWLPALRDAADLLAQAEALALDAGAWPTCWPARLLVDGPRPGSGRTGDWERAAAIAARWPVALAGGLDPDTVADALRRVRPVAVDVSSGVESQLGVKDPARVSAFVDAVRALEGT